MNMNRLQLSSLLALIVAACFLSIASCLHIRGIESSLVNSPLSGPASRAVQVLFSQDFTNIPQVLISIFEFHFTLQNPNHYSVSVHNITTKGFEVLYTTQSKMIFSAQLSWLAFDQSDYFGEVIHVEEHSTGILAQFKETGDEHRTKTTNVPFKRHYLTPPEIGIFATGASNDGIERLISANITDVSTTSFDLIVLAWHHTELTHYEFQIVTIYPRYCKVKTGRDYTWSENDHKFSQHPWNTLLLPEEREKEFRFQRYIVDMSKSSLESLIFQPDFLYTGFVGYDVKNYKPNFAEFNLALKNSEIIGNIVSMDVGVWQKTQLAGAQWNVIVCETNGFDENQGQSNKAERAFIVLSLSSILALVLSLFTFFYKEVAPSQ